MGRKEVEYVGVRKGAWTREEDLLLTKCVREYGEGKWHLVPLRAGLKRCRKSCRMRWLNYLSPNLKRGYFTKDEVDLILRMHKLLGNRWSLIAGRIPGRTANDVKNYWNSHICKKLKPYCRHDEIQRATTTNTTSSTNIIKPRPRTFTVSEATSFSSALMMFKFNRETNDNGQNLKLNPMAEQDKDERRLRWWTNLLQITENYVGGHEGEGGGNPNLFLDENQKAMLPISSPEAYINLDGLFLD